MKQFIVFTLILNGLIFVNAACLLSISSTTVKGFVVDGGGKPLANAKVSFGETLSESETTTDNKGFFTVTAKHRPTQMLRLNVTKDGYGMREKVEFPGFAAPTDNIKVEMMQTIPATR